MKVQVVGRFSDELRRNLSTLHEISRLRAEQEAKSCQIIAETPRLKAVTEIGDRNTAAQLAKEFNAGLLATLFVVTDTSGKPLAMILGSGESTPALEEGASLHIEARTKAGSDVIEVGGEAYRIASSPIVAGTDLLGMLTIGFRIKPEDIAFIKGLTNSEVMLAAGDKRILCTDSSNGDFVLARALAGAPPGGSVQPIFTFDARSESYVGAFYQLGGGGSGVSSISFLLFKPINREVEQALTPVLKTLLVLSVVVLIVTGLIGFFISGSITKPIAALVRGTSEVSRGNYDVRIDVKTGGELKFLSQKFEEMGSSLKKNIDQLARQNVELQDTLRELKETQDERLRLSTNLHLLLESTGEGIFGIDNAGLCTFINRAGARLLGYSQSDIIGKDMHLLTHDTREDGSPYPLSQCPIDSMLKTGKGCIVDGEVMWKRDRVPLPVEYSAYPITVDQEIRGGVVVFADVTERRMLRQQLMQTQKIESIGRLAGGIAHDFNNILAIIMGHAVLLNRLPADSPKRPDSVAAIDRAAVRGAGLVRQLLTFARKTDVLLESVQMNDVITEVAKLLNETFPKTLVLSMQLENNLLPVHADANQLHQVLVNLCVNARDAMPNGGTLSLTTRQIHADDVRARFPGAAGGEYVKATVSDSGTGMDERTLARIFEPFFTTKEVGKGTGLGLAVVFGIVETHKGFIDVQSAVGKGTSFHLYFPVQIRSIPPAAVARTEVEDIAGGKETILFVEDEEMLKELITGVLEGKGYTIMTAGDGEEMIRKYSRHREEIELIISDIGLPKLDGFEAFKRIKATDPEVRVILASGYLEPHAKSEILKAGAKEFIQKPYSPDEVLKKVRQVLDDR